MNEGVIDREDVGRRDTSPEDKSSYKRILPGDIGYNTMRMWQGVSGLSSVKGIISPAYTVVTPRIDRIDPRYAAHLFKSARMIFDFERFSQGLTSDTWNLKFPAFSKIRVFLPNIDEQKRQTSLLDILGEEIVIQERRADTYARQKRGLMEKLLSGEWRVEI
jgi:type I restriction enzyme S subunit